MAAVYLKKNEERRIKSGHLWIFSNEIERADTDINNGDIVDVFSFGNKKLGSGFYNKNSLIAVRLLSNKYQGNISQYLNVTLIDAFEMRKNSYPDRDSFRLCFSESDFLPGLIIDKYNNSFVLQIYSVGMQYNIENIINTLTNEFNAENIFTMNDMYFRKLEGLEEKDIVYKGMIQDEIISDERIKYYINFIQSQKTGFYFDQGDNRVTLSGLAKGKSVLDCFCNQGGFGLHCALLGAELIEFVDSSSVQINHVKRNLTLNDLNIKTEYSVDDVFDHLNRCIEKNIKYDIVNIDPPAFAKNKKSVPVALKGYEKLNSLAMKCVKPGGLLSTSSCSHHVNRENFIGAVAKAAEKNNLHLQQIIFNSASKDHPSLPFMPETTYLKFAIFRVF